MDYLFVYGTLLKQFDHEVLQPLQKLLHFEGNGSLQGELYNLGEYPGFIETGKGVSENVKGEVYLILNPEEVFTALDRYEGEEYSRKQKLVRLNTKKIRCWVYVYRLTPNPEHEKIMSGDYIAFIRNKG